ncbi:MAG: pyridoxal phosphate-dependent aminotransferase [Bacteroidales bacterium]|jgi:aspartate aminotransferase
MDFLSDRIKSMAASATLAMTQKSRELKNQGFDVISLSIGEPDFNTPDYVKEAAKRAIDDNFSKYPPVSGYEDLRAAVCAKFKRENGLDYTPDQVVVSVGGKHSVINVIMVTVNPGDEVIILAPYWVSYYDQVKLAGGVPVIVNTTLENDFKVTPTDLEAAITPKTKLIIFNSPSNPTGMVYTREEMEKIARVVGKNPHVLILSDEVYEHIVYEGEHVSMASFDFIYDRTITLNAVSKSYAMTGWRIGYIGAPVWLAKAVNKLQGQFTSGTCTIAQKAACAAMSYDDGSRDKMREAFKRRRDLICGLLAEVEGVKTRIPQGAFYVLPDISFYLGKSDGEKIVKSADDLAFFLLDRARVATVGGDAFGAPNCIRISYATSDDHLIEAVKRIKESLKLLK